MLKFYTKWLLIPLILLSIEAVIVYWLLNKEKKDPIFAEKISKIRAKLDRYAPSKNTKDNAVFVGILIVLIYLFLTGTGYTDY